MSRSYHITKKAADEAMDSGDLEPTWQLSEKSEVKDKVGKRRNTSEYIKSITGKALPKKPNRAIVSHEKTRTAASMGRSEHLDRTLNKILET